MGMPVNNKIDGVVVDHSTQLGIAEHPPLRHRLRAERRRRRCEVGHDHS
jgi:hypothetical protein